MDNRAEKFYSVVKNNYPQIICEQTNQLFRELEKASTVEQGKAIKECLKIMQADKLDVQAVLRSCNCLSDSVIAKAKKSYTIANGDLMEFLRLLNEQHIGGGQLHIDDNGKIIGLYSSCYCGIPKATKDMPSCYCECSAGWFEKLFSSVFERKVEVKLICSILGGASECVFEIS